MSDFKIIDVTELNAMLQQEAFCLIDVRTDAEVANGKIANSEHIPLHLLPLRLSELDKKSITIFYCQIGGRSAQAASFASSNGFVDVYNVQGGIVAWRNAGLLTV